MIHVEHLSVSTGSRTILRDVTCRIEGGEIVGLAGPNGAGKSTLIRTVAGLITPSAGTVRLNAPFGYVAQTFSLYGDLTVRENIEFFARCQAVEPKAAVRLANDTLMRTGLSGLAGERTGRLSHGWKQRVALAAALVHQPAILLLDEATAGLDPESRTELWALLHRCRDSGMAILLSTHHLDEISQCSRFLHMSNGELRP